MPGLLRRDRALVYSPSGRALLAESCAPQCCGATDFDVIAARDCCNPTQIARYIALAPDPPNGSWPSLLCGDPRSRCANPPTDRPVLVKFRFDTGVISCYVTDPAIIRPYSQLSDADRRLVVAPVGAYVLGYTSDWGDTDCRTDPECPTCPTCCVPVVQDPSGVCGPSHCCECGEDTTVTVNYVSTTTVDITPVFYVAGQEVIWPETFRAVEVTRTTHATRRFTCGWNDDVGEATISTTEWPFRFAVNCDNYVYVTRGTPTVTEEAAPWQIYAGPGDQPCGYEPEAGIAGASPYVDGYAVCVLGEPMVVTETGTACAGTRTLRSLIPGGEWRNCATTWNIIKQCLYSEYVGTFTSDAGLLWSGACDFNLCAGPQCDGGPSSFTVRAHVNNQHSYSIGSVVHAACLDDVCGGSLPTAPPGGSAPATGTRVAGVRASTHAYLTGVALGGG